MMQALLLLTLLSSAWSSDRTHRASHDERLQRTKEKILNRIHMEDVPDVKRQLHHDLVAETLIDNYKERDEDMNEVHMAIIRPSGESPNLLKLRRSN
jgi:hypothetical protein